MALSRMMTTLLYGVSAGAPLTFVAVAALLSCVALMACHIAVRRAMRVDPLVALRYESGVLEVTAKVRPRRTCR